MAAAVELPPIHCRICQLSILERTGSKNLSILRIKPVIAPDLQDELMRLGCACQGEISVAHYCCALRWFVSLGDTICEICQSRARNVREKDMDYVMALFGRRRVRIQDAENPPATIRPAAISDQKGNTSKSHCGVQFDELAFKAAIDWFKMAPVPAMSVAGSNDSQSNNSRDDFSNRLASGYLTIAIITFSLICCASIISFLAILLALSPSAGSSKYVYIAGGSVIIALLAIAYYFCSTQLTAVARCFGGRQ